MCEWLVIAVMWLVGIYRARCVRVCSSGYVGRYCPGIFKVKRALGLPAGFQGQAYVNTRVKEPRLAIFPEYTILLKMVAWIS